MTVTTARPDHRQDADVLAALDHDDRSDADEHLVLSAYLPWAHSLSRPYRRRGIDDDDLEQVAGLGLLKALRRYSCSRGALEPYAKVTITGELKRAFRDTAWTIRPPRRLQELRPRVEEARLELEQEGVACNAEAIADRLGVSRADVREAQQAATTYRLPSLDERSADVVATAAGDEDPRLAMLDELIPLGVVCRGLSVRDRQLIELRFLREMTQQAIGEQMGISQMQVSRELQRLLGTLREELHDVE